MRILIDNALTHTPPGTQIVVTAGRDDGRVRLAVRDDGEGIDGQALPRIFEPFYTADDAQGSGLGLAIASELAERMAGRPVGALELGSDRVHARDPGLTGAGSRTARDGLRSPSRTGAPATSRCESGRRG